MKIRSILLGGAAIAMLSPLGASAFQVFMQDFESGLSADERINADSSTRHVWCDAGQCPYSGVNGATASNPYQTNTGGGDFKNWGVHDKNTNPHAGGTAGSYVNHNMQGNVLGHIKANYSNHEDNYYEILNLDLASDWTNVNLMFDFDSWIQQPDDGFAVSYNDGSGWSLLNPTAASDMQYANLGHWDGSGGNLNDLSGYTNGTDQCGTIGVLGGTGQCGFNGMNPSEMSGVAMFDLTGLSGSIDLRFSFASNGDGVIAEGINIDNIKITADCANGNTGPGCGGNPGTGIPEPGSLALMMLGATAVYRRRKKAA